MQKADENQENLWSDLESEFEEREGQPLALSLPDPPSRQRTVDVANLQSLFSGFYPVLLLCLVAGLLGLSDPRQTLLLGTTCFLAFPMAWLFAPTMRGAKRGWGYYALTALLVGGMGELMVAFSDGLLNFGLSQKVSVPKFLVSLERQMESFYSLSHWFFYGVLGIGVAYLTHRIRGRAPWMDSPKTRKLHGIMAAVLLAVPLLLPISCFILGSVFWMKTDWYISTVHRNPQLERFPTYNTRQRVAWDKLYASWREAVPGKGTYSNLIERTPVAEVHRLEKAYLELAGSGQPGRMWGGSREQINRILLSRKDQLKTPYRLARLMVAQTMSEHQLDGHFPELPEQWEFLLETLSKTQIDRAEGLSLLKQLQAYDESAEKPIGDIDRYVLAVLSLSSPFVGEEQTKLALFGIPFKYSPRQLYFLYEVRPVLNAWLELREQMIGLEEEQQLAMIRKHADAEGTFLRWAATKPYDYELRPLWQAAAVMTASRLYRIEHGSWPSQVSDLSSFLWFEPKVGLTQVPDGLQIQDTDRSRLLK
jgi:hypothetical protein